MADKISRLAIVFLFGRGEFSMLKLVFAKF